MGIHVTWGNNHPPYDKTKNNYNSPLTKWNRYSENIKRGYILKNQKNVWFEIFHNGVSTNLNTKPENPLNPIHFTNGLLYLQIMKEDGFNKLFNLEKSNTSIEITNKTLNSLMKKVKSELGEEYHNWGLNGDEYSFENNPFEQINTNDNNYEN